MNPCFTVVLIEDDPETHDRLSKLIDASPALELIATASNYEAGVQALYMHTPDVALIDLGLPDRSGIELIKWLSRNKPRVESLVITAFGDEDHVVRSLEAGATGYLLKDYSEEELSEHIVSIKNGGSPISPLIARKLMRKIQSRPLTEGFVQGLSEKLVARNEVPPAFSQESLTDRELTVIRQIARGFTAAEIAEQMGISAHTVSTHVKRIYRKLHVRNRAEAIYEAQITGLLDG